jgi:hypothetical protein
MTPTAVRARAESKTTSSGIDARRVLQLILAAIWLLDGLLQYQPSMYSTMFGQMIGGGAAGNPAVVARPILWGAALVAGHLVLLNTVFAAFQLLLGLGIAYRPTVRVALAASIAWSLAVWWFGEGLGGVLSGSASPVSGAPGALILALVVAAFVWVFGEAFGQILTGGATDPNSGPLLALLALAYWPLATAGPEGKGA